MNDNNNLLLIRCPIVKLSEIIFEIFLKEFLETLRERLKEFTFNIQ